MQLIDIVIAEDDKDIAELLSGLLADEGYQTHIYFSGAEALSAIGQEVPDLVITDLQMEHKEAGLELLQHLRANPTTQHIPAILYSADTNFLRRKAQGIHDNNCTLLEKPFELHNLLTIVETALLKSRSRH